MIGPYTEGMESLSLGLCSEVKPIIRLLLFDSMDLETAAQIGEALGGIAILMTMLFGLRQIVEWNQSRKNEISQQVASHLSTPMIQLGMSVITNELSEGFTIRDVAKLTREQKNAINAILVGLNNHAIMTYQGHLSLEILSAYYQPYSMILDKRVRKIVGLTSGWKEDGEGMGEKIGPFDWVIWLLDKMEQQPKATVPVYVLHKDWKGN